MKQLDGKTALITGGAGGIGRATALLFASEGAAVGIVDLNQEAGQEVAREISTAGGRAVFERADVTRPADCRRVVERTVHEFGGIHILFNNAGIIRRASAVEISEADWDAVMAVNVKSIFLMSREVIPIMARAEGGSIINTASGWGLAGGARPVAYCASKAALNTMTVSLARALAPAVRVVSISPGLVDTDFIQGLDSDWRHEQASRTPLGRLASPEDVSRAVLAVATMLSYSTGSIITVDGGRLLA